MNAPALLIDTNIWVDLELDGGNGEAVRTFMLAAKRNGARLGIAAHSLKDVFVIVERRLKQAARSDARADSDHMGPAARAAAWAAVSHILEIAEVVGSDYLDAHMATKERVFHDYYEDNLIVAAARRMEADLLVTNDVSLLKHASVAALPLDRATEWLAT